MLVRRNTDGSRDCIPQEHHAALCAFIAARWDVPFTAEHLLAIALHDSPWRDTDRVPDFDAGRGDILDFVQMPISRRLAFYSDGIDDLERVDPYAAYMTSRHYTSFSGTSEFEAFQDAEARRRERLERRVASGLLATEAVDLKWLQYFDVLSLWICLTGPDVDADQLPPWLSTQAYWNTLPDGRTIEHEWKDVRTAQLAPWPLDVNRLDVYVSSRPVGCPSSASALATAWQNAAWQTRTVTLVPG